jgi:predicted  nucleic acid-binding Zn-ribbon protein
MNFDVDSESLRLAYDGCKERRRALEEEVEKLRRRCAIYEDTIRALEDTIRALAGEVAAKSDDPWERFS